VLQIKLKELRETRKISQQKLAKQLGVTQSTVAMWENGKNKPEHGTLTKIADFFGVSIDSLIGRDRTGKNENGNIGFDDFTYAMRDESKELTDAQKEQLLAMARFFKSELEKEKKDN
jgi:transcriptional regulator with XRE-family HTH domain